MVDRTQGKRSGIPWHRVGRSFGQDRPDHLGYDITGAPDDHHVAGPHILGRDLILVVQGRIRHRDPADKDRLERRERCRRAVRSDRNDDVVQSCCPLLGWEFVRNRPAGSSRCTSELALLVEVVDLHDDTVEFVVEFVPLLLVFLDERDDIVECLDDRCVFVDPEPERREEVERGRMVSNVGPSMLSPS